MAGCSTQVSKNKKEKKKFTNLFSFYFIYSVFFVFFFSNILEWFQRISFIMVIVILPRHLPIVQDKYLRRILIRLKIDKVGIEFINLRILLFHELKFFNSMLKFEFQEF